jgi:hypothetical protein
MKHSRHWGSVNVPHDEQAPVDADGWPTGDAGVTIMVGVPHMAGVYKLSFTGHATVAPVARSDLTTRVQNMVYDAGTNTSTADVVLGPDETNLFLVFTGTSGGVKNVKLMRPGYLPTDTFSKPFLDRLAMFQVLRFIDYSRTIDNPQVNWSDRMLPTSATQHHPAGAAWEYAIELANLTGKDPWINIPDQATNHYVRQLATLFRDNLAPDRKLYVEWSNEVWNSIFDQTQRNYDATNAEIATGRSNLNYDGETNPAYLAWRRTARRAKEVSDIFRSVFGAGGSSRAPGHDCPGTRIHRQRFRSAKQIFIRDRARRILRRRRQYANRPHRGSDIRRTTRASHGAEEQCASAHALGAVLQAKKRGIRRWTPFNGQRKPECQARRQPRPAHAELDHSAL